MPAEERNSAVALGVQLPGVSDEEHAASLAELARLGKTLGVDVVARVTQRRAKLEKATVVGAGKLKELAALTGGSGEVPMGPPGRRGKSDGEDASDVHGVQRESAGAEPVVVAGGAVRRGQRTLGGGGGTSRRTRRLHRRRRVGRAGGDGGCGDGHRPCDPRSVHAASK